MNNVSLYYYLHREEQGSGVISSQSDDDDSSEYTSVFLRFKPKKIADQVSSLSSVTIVFQFLNFPFLLQLTWIDANIIFSSFSSEDVLLMKFILFFLRLSLLLSSPPHLRSNSHGGRSPEKCPKRYMALACWVEKEVLECNPSHRMKLVEAIIEVMHYLFSLRNFFSYNAFKDAMGNKFSFFLFR